MRNAEEPEYGKSEKARSAVCEVLQSKRRCPFPLHVGTRDTARLPCAMYAGPARIKVNTGALRHVCSNIEDQRRDTEWQDEEQVETCDGEDVKVFGARKRVCIAAQKAIKVSVVIVEYARDAC